MDIQAISKLVLNNMTYIVGILGVLVIVMYGIIINLALNLSALKKSHRKMMTGVDGANLEQMLIQHIEEVKQVAEKNRDLEAENQRLDGILQTAITHVGVVRFRAFEDMGSDLSYAVALLDAHHNGVVLSSIFGREDSRSYVKPIKDGQSNYTLTEEEQQALHEAMQS